MKEIVITSGNQKIRVGVIEGILAEEFLTLLPLKSQLQIWGEEIYFYISRKLKKITGLQSEVELGDFAYWPEGPALCVFLGPTPISKRNKIIPASDVAVLGKVINLGEINIHHFLPGEDIRVEMDK